MVNTNSLIIKQFSLKEKEESFNKFKSLYLPNYQQLPSNILEVLRNLKNVEVKKVGWGRVGNEGLEVIYNLVLNINPKLVVETGVAYGATTITILSSLKDGRLISVDKEKDVGFLVGFLPQNCKEKWKLLVGKSVDVLPTINEDVDIFIHDSLHTYKNMMFEFEWALSKHPKFIISHDIGFNNSFFDFANKHQLPFYFLKSRRSYYGMGVVVSGK